MTKKLSQFDSGQRDAIYKELEALSDNYDKKSITTASGHFGLCDTCSRCQLAKFEFREPIAFCSHFETRLGKDRVVECTGYYERGRMSLWDMQQVAYILETGKQIGFIGEEEK